MSATSSKKTTLIRYTLYGAFAIAAYFGYVEWQTRLGEKALAATGLETHSLEESFLVAATENKNVLAALSAIWCPTCRSLDKNVFSDEIVKEAIRSKYVFARIEYESQEGKAFRELYDVSVFPTLLELQADGAKIRELPISTDPAQFLPLL